MVQTEILNNKINVLNRPVIYNTKEDPDNNVVTTKRGLVSGIAFAVMTDFAEMHGVTVTVLARAGKEFQDGSSHTFPDGFAFSSYTAVVPRGKVLVETSGTNQDLRRLNKQVMNARSPRQA